MERCANCNRSIGNLETPYVYAGRVVCDECYSRLMRNKVEYASPHTPPPRPVEAVAAEGFTCSCGQQLAASAATCPKCGRRYTTATTAVLAIVIGLIVTFLLIMAWLREGGKV